ncbi:MAG: hypothetical protein MUC28_00070 [Planctomycetes bacterium]|jgi:hypothetical protein|nr:hypothetical protein [Planctomycetota bacterium]
MFIPSVESILDRVGKETSKVKAKQGTMLTVLILALAIRGIVNKLSRAAENLLAAIKAEVCKGELKIDENGELPMLVIGHEDYYYDYDPPYIRGVKAESEEFSQKTGLEVIQISESEPHQLYRDHGPFHVVPLQNLIVEIEQALTEEGKIILKGARETFENLNRSETERIAREKQEAREKKIAFIKGIIGIAVSLSSEAARKIAEKIADLNLSISERVIAGAGDWIVVAVHQWDTSTTSSTVTDYSTRQVYAFNSVTNAMLVSKGEKKLWRTTSSGVVCEQYSDKIRKAEIEEGCLKISFWDGEVVIGIN